MDDRWGWIAAAVAAVPAALAAWLNRKGAKEQREGDWRERGTSSLFDRQAAELARAIARQHELEADLTRTEADRNRGWGLARAWFDRAHDERHRHCGSLQVAMTGRASAEELQARTPARLPEFQAIACKDPPP